MKIQTDQLNTLQQTTESSSDTNKVADGFASLLAKEVGTQAVQDSGLTAPLLSGLNTLDLSEAQDVDTATTSSTATADDAETSTMDSLGNLLDQWDDYTAQLADNGQGDSLKKAYGTLTNIADGVQNLKNNLPVDASSGLSSLVNEMDVMTTTEQIKFDRGDYV